MKVIVIFSALIIQCFSPDDKDSTESKENTNVHQSLVSSGLSMGGEQLQRRTFTHRDLYIIKQTENLPEFAFVFMYPKFDEKYNRLMKPIEDKHKKLFNGYLLSVLFKNYRSRVLVQLPTGLNDTKLKEYIDSMDNCLNYMYGRLDRENVDYHQLSNAWEAIQDKSYEFQYMSTERPINLVEHKELWDKVDFEQKINGLVHEIYIITNRTISDLYDAVFSRRVTTCKRHADCLVSVESQLDFSFIEITKLVSDFRFIFALTKSYDITKFIINEVFIEFDIIPFLTPLFANRKEYLLTNYLIYPQVEKLRKINWKLVSLSEKSLNVLNDLKIYGVKRAV